MKVIVIAAALIAATATSSFAQGTIDARQARQQARINQGVASGQLNARETNNLARGQAHVQRMENRAKADGIVTRGERMHINHAQNVQSHRIFNKKHNWR